MSPHKKLAQALYDIEQNAVAEIPRSFQGIGEITKRPVHPPAGPLPPGTKGYISPGDKYGICAAIAENESKHRLRRRLARLAQFGKGAIATALEIDRLVISPLAPQTTSIRPPGHHRRHGTWTKR